MARSLTRIPEAFGGTVARPARGEPNLAPGPAADIVDLFRQLRRSRPLTVGQIAVRADRSSSHVSEVLRGWKAPSPAAAAKIAAALGATPEIVRKAVMLAERLGELNRHQRRLARTASRESVTDAQPDSPPLDRWDDADRSGQREGLSGRGIAWPHRVGIVPLRAQCLQHRPVADALLASLTLNGREASSTSTVVMSGLGGVGKTQLAAECAEQLLATASIDLLVWITAMSRPEIESGLAQAGFEVTGIGDAETPSGARRFLAWLAMTSRRWLVVFDDLASPADLTGLWPPGVAAGRTVITTRRRDSSLAGPDRDVLEVGLFSSSEAVSYLEARLAGHSHLLPGAAALAADLDFLPLALAQAAAYLLDRDLSCEQYRGRLADHRAKLGSLLPEADALPDAHRQTLATTWSLSIDLADRLAPAGVARPLLELSAVLSSHSTPAEVFMTDSAREYVARAPGRHTQPDHRATSPHDCRDGLHCLARLSLMAFSTTSATPSVQVHSLVQRAVIDELPADKLEQAMRSAADALNEAWPQVERDPVLGQELRASAEALLALTENAANGVIHPVFFTAGRSLGNSGAAEAAISYFERLRSISQQNLGPDHPDTLAARQEIYHWRGESGDLRAAATGFESLVRDLTKALGADHPATLAARHEVARTLGQAGDAAAAVRAYQELFADRARVLGLDDPITLTTQGNFEWWRARAGDVAGAIAGLEDLLAKLTRLFGSGHRDTLAVRHNIAYWRAQAGDPAAGVAGFADLLADLVQISGAEHPDALNARNSLAWWTGEAGDAAGAAVAYELLLTDCERVLGADHRLTTIARHNLAHWRGRSGNPAGAAAAYADLIAARRRALGADHPYTLNSRSDLARWRGEAGDPLGAAAELEELLADRIRILGRDDPAIQITLRNLAGWRARADDPAGAMAALEQLLEHQLRTRHPDDDEVLATQKEIERLRAEATK